MKDADRTPHHAVEIGLFLFGVGRLVIDVVAFGYLIAGRALPYRRCWGCGGCASSTGEGAAVLRLRLRFLRSLGNHLLWLARILATVPLLGERR